MAKKKAPPGFVPYVAKHLSNNFQKECIVAAPTFEGVLVVYQCPSMPELPGDFGAGVRVIVRHNRNLPGTQFADLAVDENTSLQSAIARIKQAMLAHGTVPEAVRLIGELSPFTEGELKIMAYKLTKGKDSAKPVGGGGKLAKTSGTGDKPDAKAPKGKETKPAAGKGNVEALAKAREARSAEGAKDKKYKVLVKPKDIKMREGSWTTRMLEIILGNTSTDAAKAELASDKEHSEKRLDFGWAAKKGYISEPA